jgi:hypothetical protein
MVTLLIGCKDGTNIMPWEYRVISLNKVWACAPDSKPFMEKEFSEDPLGLMAASWLGNDGWEAFAIAPDGAVWFKRAVPEEPRQKTTVEWEDIPGAGSFFRE